MTGRVVVFGATGYTGRLAVSALVARGARPVLAGRDASRLAALGDEHGGLPAATADARRPETVAALVEAGDVLVSTVGPFTAYGRAALDGAIASGAHYVDSTGEAPFVREVFAEAGPRAGAAGVALLTALGFDFVPGNLAGALALRAAGGAARRLDVGYFVGGGGISSGTRASGVLLATRRGHARRSGRLVETAFGRDVRRFAVDGRERAAVLFGGTEPLALPRLAPGLDDVATYLGAFGVPLGALRAASYALPVLSWGPVGRRVAGAVEDRALRRTGEGPDAAARSGGRCTVVAVAADRDGREVAAVRLDGPDPYEFTGALLADAALRLAAGEVAGTGALGPVDAYGIEALERACAAAGLRRSG